MKYKSVIFTSSFMAVGLTSSLVVGCATKHDSAEQVLDRIDNKNFLVYYRAWRDKEMKGVNTDIDDPNWITMFDIPYGINYVNVFSYVPKGQEGLAAPYFEKLKNDYAPYLHSRGVKLIRGFDYSELLKIDYEGSFPTEEEFDNHAQKLIDELMTPWGLDGLDIDMETHPDKDEVAISDGVIKSLAKLIGPKANNGTAFFYDTNASYIEPFQNVADCFDLLAYQQYGSSSQRTEKAVNDYQPYIDSSKFLPGLTFPEEKDNNRWYDQKEPYEESNMYDVAKYSYDNDLAGMFLYALDRDGRTYNEPDYSHIIPSNLLWTKTALLEANGASLETAKELAHHHLARVRYAHSLLDEDYAKYEEKVNLATNLYEVNKALLAENQINPQDLNGPREFSNPNYDPILEDKLRQFDHQPSLDLVQEVRDYLEKENGDLEELKDACDALVNLLASKEYSERELDNKTETLRQIIAKVSQSNS